MDVNTFGTGVISDGALSDAITKEFDLRPRAIINKFDLQRPIYKATASYGHFGREQFPWEQTDMAEQLKKYAAAEK